MLGRSKNTGNEAWSGPNSWEKLDIMVLKEDDEDEKINTDFDQELLG